jgi:hypothetical protein
MITITVKCGCGASEHSFGSEFQPNEEEHQVDEAQVHVTANYKPMCYSCGKVDWMVESVKPLRMGAVRGA